MKGAYSVEDLLGLPNQEADFNVPMSSQYPNNTMDRFSNNGSARQAAPQQGDDRAYLAQLLNNMSQGGRDNIDFNKLLDLYAPQPKPKDFITQFDDAIQAAAKYNRAHPGYGLGPAISEGFSALDLNGERQREAQRLANLGAFERLSGIASNQYKYGLDAAKAQRDTQNQDVLNQLRMAQAQKSLRAPAGRAAAKPKVFPVTPQIEDRIDNIISQIESNTPGLKSEYKDALRSAIAEEYSQNGNLIAARQKAISTLTANAPFVTDRGQQKVITNDQINAQQKVIDQAKSRSGYSRTKVVQALKQNGWTDDQIGKLRF